MRKVLAHEPLAGSLSAEYWPGAGVVSDEAVMDYVRGMAGSIFHPCGTVRMGNAKSAPVEPSLCFKGLEGLRVVDASIIPSIPSGNINAICIALAEKGADMILKSNR
jgi:choline dehydrogenase